MEEDTRISDVVAFTGERVLARGVGQEGWRCEEGITMAKKRDAIGSVQ